MKNKLSPLIMLFVMIALVGVCLVVGFNNTTDSRRNDSNGGNSSHSYSRDGEVTEVEYESVPYGTVTVDDSNLEYGQEVVRTNGRDGRKKIYYSVVYKDDIEISRKIIKEEVDINAQDKVIARGTKIVWRCVDNTSYNHNCNDDNKCTSSTGEVRDVSDSQAESLDPTYRAPRYGSYCDRW